MKIGEVAVRAGVTIKTVRHWEAEGLLPQVPRRGAYRRFDTDHLARVRLVVHCRDQGFSLPEVRQILALLPESGCPDPVAMKALVTARLSEVRREMQRLEEVAARLETTRAYLEQRAVDSPLGGDGSLGPEVNDGPHRHSDF